MQWFYFHHGRTYQDVKKFKHFLFVKYVTDITFQQGNRPSANMQEERLYFSGKRKLYGFKVEVKFLANGFATSCSSHYPGSVSYLENFQRNVDLHETALRKKGLEIKITYLGLLLSEYPDHWAILMDKGYQGAAEVFRAVTPKRNRRTVFFPGMLKLIIVRYLRIVF